VTVLAHQALLHALPFVVPAFLVVGVVAAIVYRDRRAEHREDDAA
jgi:hypothetical protein